MFYCILYTYIFTFLIPLYICNVLVIIFVHESDNELQLCDKQHWSRLWWQDKNNKDDWVQYGGSTFEDDMKG